MKFDKMPRRGACNQKNPCLVVYEFSLFQQITQQKILHAARKKRVAESSYGN